MKTCLVCQADCIDESPYCPFCGEASFSAPVSLKTKAAMSAAPKGDDADEDAPKGDKKSKK